MNNWVEVPHASHKIANYCIEERCVSCGNPAAHKIGEYSGAGWFHPLTAYLCCKCLPMNCGFGVYGDLEN